MFIHTCSQNHQYCQLLPENNLIVLSDLTTSHLSQNVAITILSHHIISPLLKKPTLDKEQLCNYRPILNLSLVILTFDLLTLNSWRTWRVTWPTLPPSLNTLCLSVLDLWVITFPFGYPDLPIHYTTSLVLRRRLRVVYSRESPLIV